MFLLSDVADRIRAEIPSLSSVEYAEIRLGPCRNDLRTGDERALIELLILSTDLIGRTWGSFVLELSATDDAVRVSYRRERSGRADLMAVPPSLAGKIGVLGGDIDDDGSLRIPMPAAVDVPVVDLPAAARRTGLTDEEIRSIVDGFMKDGRINIRVLTAGDYRTNSENRIRAAHSLKGAGRSLCAFELAIAAAAVEADLRKRGNTSASIQRIEGVWKRIEEWYSRGAE